MRYTEARLSRIATALLEDIDKETVDFRPNYDESEREPEVLPTRVPNLLVNGSAGIAVGMATNIPPHNLTEIINATIQLIQHPHTPLAQILELVPGPDFPTAVPSWAGKASSTRTHGARAAQDSRSRGHRTHGERPRADRGDRDSLSGQ